MDTLQAAIMRARTDTRVVKFRQDPAPKPKYRDYRPSSPAPPAETKPLKIWERLPIPPNPVIQIQKAVADYFGMTVDLMLSPRRTRNLARPRQIAMYLCKVLTMKSYPEIGRRFGGRDHTTALAAIQRVELLMKEKPIIAAQVAEIRARLI